MIVTYAKALCVARTGRKIRLPTWNDESYLCWKEDREVLFVGSRESACQIRPSEKLRADWQIL